MSEDDLSIADLRERRASPSCVSERANCEMQSWKKKTKMVRVEEKLLFFFFMSF